MKLVLVDFFVTLIVVFVILIVMSMILIVVLLLQKRKELIVEKTIIVYNFLWTHLLALINFVKISMAINFQRNYLYLFEQKIPYNWLMFFFFAVFAVYYNPIVFFSCFWNSNFFILIIPFIQQIISHWSIEDFYLWIEIDLNQLCQPSNNWSSLRTLFPFLV